LLFKNAKFSSVYFVISVSNKNQRVLINNISASMKRVLIITYYWPPSGGSGVQRWLKFTKYLPEFGVKPIVFTADNGEYPAEDTTLKKDIHPETEIIKTPIWEPYSFYKKFTGQKSEKKVSVGFISDKVKPSLTQQMAVFLRGNFFIPDARMFWIKPSVKYLRNYLAKNPVDAIITSGPPHTCHMIGLELKKIFGIKWIADFRDPWTGIYYFDELMLSPFAKHLHHRMEKSVLQNADRILTVGETMKKDFAKMTSVPIDVITNGYDEEDYSGKNIPLTEKFTLSNIGLLPKGQNHPALWNAIGELTRENDNFKENLEIRFVGHVDAHVKKSLEEAGITNYCKMIDYVDHEKVVAYQKSSRILLLNINRVVNAEYLLTGKLFEYLAAERPILCVGPKKGDAAKIIDECKSGEVFDFDDKEGIKKFILARFGTFQSGETENKNSLREKYSRKELTRGLAEKII
jgi:hypothetical protein